MNLFLTVILILFLVAVFIYFALSKKTFFERRLFNRRMMPDRRIRTFGRRIAPREEEYLDRREEILTRRHFKRRREDKSSVANIYQ